MYTADTMKNLLYCYYAICAVTENTGDNASAQRFNISNTMNFLCYIQVFYIITPELNVLA